MAYYVYILASQPNGTLYIGVTNDLIRRVHEHKEGFVPGFSKKYDVKQLVYFETHERIENPLQREKNLKHWPRAWKVSLVERRNPYWEDLADHISR